uniref:Putative secreted protein n=1 Tax=Ixodes ricinus TaxID=34613 RepID=A0A6B0TZ40_IXORI
MTAKLFFLITQLLLIFAGHDPASGPCSTSQVRCQDLASAFLYHQDALGPCCFVTSPSFPMLAPSPT